MPQTDDFRKDPRISHQSTIFFEDLDSQATASASLRNYSRQGIYFESDERFLPGQELIIGIDQSPYSSSNNIHESYFIKIKWFKELYNGDYRFGYGAKLQLPSDLDSRGSSPKQAPALKRLFEEQAQELRRHPRQPFARPIFFARQDRYFRGRSRNISRGGLFIETDEPFEIGQNIRLVIPKTKYDNGMMIKGRIIHLHPNGIGVRFTGLIRQKK